MIGNSHGEMSGWVARPTSPTILRVIAYDPFNEPFVRSLLRPMAQSRRLGGHFSHSAATVGKRRMMSAHRQATEDPLCDNLAVPPVRMDEDALTFVADEDRLRVALEAGQPSLDHVRLVVRAMLHPRPSEEASPTVLFIYLDGHRDLGLQAERIEGLQSLHWARVRGKPSSMKPAWATARSSSPTTAAVTSSSGTNSPRSRQAATATTKGRAGSALAAEQGTAAQMGDAEVLGYTSGLGALTCTRTGQHH